MSKVIRQYEPTDASEKALIQAVNEAWVSAVTRNKKARQLLKIPPGKPVTENLKIPPYRVKKRGGAAVESAVVLIYLGHKAVQFGSKVLNQVWDGIVYPYLKKKFALQSSPDATATKPKKPARKTVKARKTAKKNP